MQTRRQSIATISGATAALAMPAPKDTAQKFTICAFSKHFQWAGIEEMAQQCAAIGYEGVDLTLRPGGHVEPERVEQDLPKAVEVIRKAGLSIPMVTSGIADIASPHAEKVIRTLAAQNIRYYRWGEFKYNDKAPLPVQLDEIKRRVKDLAAMNKQYGVTAMYHTHSGAGRVGASFWDLYLLLKDFDTNSVSANFDIGHATVEGGLGGWLHSAKLLLPYTRGIAVKDFVWERNAKGLMEPRWCGLGQGQVDFKKFLPMVKAANFKGPLQLHMEYHELGGADSGKKEYTIPKDKLIGLFRRDLDVLRKMLGEAGMV